MPDLEQYLRRPVRAQVLAGHRLLAEAPDEVRRLEQAAWDWLERERPAVLTRREAVAPRDVMEAIIAAVAAVQPPPGVRERIVERLRSQLLGAGPLEPYMVDPEVTEIMVTGTRVRVERNGRYETMPPLRSPQEATQLAEFLASRAHSRYQVTKPLQTVIWPANGARINIVHESVTGNGGPIITIRKRNAAAVLDLPDLVDRGMCSEALADWLVWAIRSRANVAIAGPTGSGKTALLRALARAAIPAWQRVVTIEDADELQLVDYFEDCPSLVGHERLDPDSPEPDVSIHMLFLNALRMKPDWVLVGEVRGAEATDVLEAGVTEQGGLLFTVHVRDAARFIERFHWMLVKSGYHFPAEVIQQQVMAAIDLVVLVDRLQETPGEWTRRAPPWGCCWRPTTWRRRPSWASAPGACPTRS